MAKISPPVSELSAKKLGGGGGQGLRLLFYIYCFIIISLATGPLSVCVTAIFSEILCTEFLLSSFSNENGTILSDCLLINFASLTLHAQASIHFIMIVIKDFSSQ